MLSISLLYEFVAFRLRPLLWEGDRKPQLPTEVTDSKKVVKDLALNSLLM